MGYPASGPQGDGWYLRITDLEKGTHTYLGGFISRQDMIDAAVWLRPILPETTPFQQYTRWNGVEDCAAEVDKLVSVLDGMRAAPAGTLYTHVTERDS